MKKILFILLAMLSLQASAQKKTPTEKAKEKTLEMQKDLSLTPDQNKKIYEVTLKAFTSIAEYDAKNPSKKLKKKQKNIVQDMRKSEFKKILTPAQFKKMEALKKKEKDEEKAKEKELEKIKTK